MSHASNIGTYNLLARNRRQKHSNIDHFDQIFLFYHFILAQCLSRDLLLSRNGGFVLQYSNKFCPYFYRWHKLTTKESITQRHMHQNDPMIKADKKKKKTYRPVYSNPSVFFRSSETAKIQLNLLLKPDKADSGFKQLRASRPTTKTSNSGSCMVCLRHCWSRLQAVDQTDMERKSLQSINQLKIGCG